MYMNEVKKQKKKTIIQHSTNQGKLKETNRRAYRKLLANVEGGFSISKDGWDMEERNCDTQLLVKKHQN